MIRRVKRIWEFWRRLDHKMLFKMIAYAPVMIPLGAATMLVVKGTEIGAFVKQYGSFRLHRYSYVLRPGWWTKDTGNYAIILGELDTPVRSGWKGDPAKKAHPDYEFVTTVPMKESDRTGVYRRLRQLRRAGEAVARLMNDHSADRDLSALRPEAAPKWREVEERNAARQRAIDDAFHQFEAEFANEIRAETIEGNKPDPTIEQLEHRMLTLFTGGIALIAPFVGVSAAVRWLWRHVTQKIIARNQRA